MTLAKVMMRASTGEGNPQPKSIALAAFLGPHPLCSDQAEVRYEHVAKGSGGSKVSRYEQGANQGEEVRALGGRPEHHPFQDRRIAQKDAKVGLGEDGLEGADLSTNWNRVEVAPKVMRTPTQSRWIRRVEQ